MNNTNNNKQLIILSHHVYVGNTSPENAKSIMEQTMKMVDDDNDPAYRYKHFFHPVKEEMNARTVCIFPNN